MSIQTKLLVALLGALFLFGAGAKLGFDYADGQAAKAELESQRLADVVRNRLQRGTDRLAFDLEEVRAAQKPKDRIIIKEVARYAQTVPVDRQCVLDGTWRLLHDAAATGIPAYAPGLAAGITPGVTDADALDTVADNYEICRQWRADLIGWQRWWSEVKEGAASGYEAE